MADEIDTKNADEQNNENWADMIEVKEGTSTEKEDMDDSKILSQEEIDSLFGNDDNRNDYVKKTGVKAILNSAVSNHERLPMLDIVFDRLIRLIATSLRNFTQDNVEVSIESVESIKFGEYIESLTLPTLLSVFRAEEWDNYGLISVDSDLVYSTVDVLLGGRRGTAAIRLEDRPYTTIELNLMKEMLDLVLADLSTAFDPVTAVSLSNERLETNPRFATITRLANPIITARLRIDMENRGGKLDIVLPYATLDSVKEILSQFFIGERYGKDTVWEKYLAEKLWNTDVELKSVIKEKEVSLSEIYKWKVGSFLPLDMSPEDDVNLTCCNIPLFRGTMGRKNNNIVVKLKGKAVKDE